MIFNPKSGSLLPKRPIFTNIALADEINRAPAKVQSALWKPWPKNKLPLVMKPIDWKSRFWYWHSEPVRAGGTYALLEAQMDRFMFKIIVNYPESLMN